MTDSDDLRRRGAIAAEARDWVERVLAHDGNAADEAAMLAWSRRDPQHAQALANAVAGQGRLLDLRDALRGDADVAAMLEAARMRLAGKRAPLRRRQFLIGAVAASAAGIALLRPPLDLWPSLGELGADYRTGTGERRTMQIAQGLAVELNTRTAMTRRDDDRAYRLKLIAGEVAVDARRLPRPAIVEGAAAIAAARDGQFSARLGDDGLCVTCLAGEVAVHAGTAPVVQLATGQRITLGGEAPAHVVAVDLNVAEAWRRGELIFNDRPLSEVVAEINRYRPGRIVLANADLSQRTVNAIFRIDRLESAPSQIRIVARATVTHLPGGIVLLS